MIDILLNENYDLQTDGNDFAFGESAQQHVELILLFQKGELRENPHVGYGIEKRLRGVSDKKRDLREMRVELENDNFINPEITFGDSLADFKIKI